MKPPPGAMMTAVPVATSGSGTYAVSVGVLTLTVVSMPPEPRLVSGCFHCSDPGATPGQRLTTFVVIEDVVACSGLLILLFACALAEVKREAASRQSAIDNFQWWCLFMGPNPGIEASAPLFPRVRFFMWCSLPSCFTNPDTRSKWPGSGSPILPTYCLFLLSGEKSVVLLPRGGYL